MTETLAWLLARDEGCLRAFATMIDDRLRALGHAGLPKGRPRVRTQVVETQAGRYDLVLDWEGAAFRVVVEVKVTAWAPSPTADPSSAQEQEQLATYLRVAAAAPRGTSFVVMLTRDAFAAPAAIREHPCYLAPLSWSDVRDALRAWLAAEPSDLVAREIGRDFVHVLEGRGMTATRITPDGLASVWTYMEFRAALDPMLDAAVAKLRDEDALRGFAAGRPLWQEVYERAGIRLLVTSAQEHFAFVGLGYSRNVLHPRTPDLMVFLETPPNSEARRRINTAFPAVVDAVEELNTEGIARWTAHRERHQIVVGRKSLQDFLAVEDQRGAIRDFYLRCFEGLWRTGLLQRYLDAVKGVGPGGSTA